MKIENPKPRKIELSEKDLEALATTCEIFEEIIHVCSSTMCYLKTCDEESPETDDLRVFNNILYDLINYPEKLEIVSIFKD